MDDEKLIEQQGFSVSLPCARKGWACTLMRDGQYNHIWAVTPSTAKSTG